MNSLVLFISENAWQPVDWFRAMESSESDTGQIVVERSDSWISLLRCDEIFSDYDGDEEQVVKSLIEVSESYIIEWKGDELLDSFIKGFPPTAGAVVDNDHGLIRNIVELKKLPICRWVRESTLAG